MRQAATYSRIGRMVFRRVGTSMPGTEIRRCHEARRNVASLSPKDGAVLMLYQDRGLRRAARRYWPLVRTGVRSRRQVVPAARPPIIQPDGMALPRRESATTLPLETSRCKTSVNRTVLRRLAR
jgi:hypothetical protein